MLRRHQPPRDQILKHHVVAAGKGESLASVAKANNLPVETLIAFNFPGGVENGRIVPEVVNWYLANHEAFRCPETPDRKNRQFKGGERLAIPKAGVSAAATPVGVGLPTSLRPHAATVRAEVRPDRQKYWQEFEDAVSKQFSIASSLVSLLEPMLGSAETLRRMANLWIHMREWGCSADDILTGFKVLATDGKGAQASVVKIVNVLSTESATLKNLVAKAKVAGLAAALIGVLLNTVIAWGRGDYHMVFVEAYKFAIGFAIPWAGLIDTLQSLVNAIWPGSNTNRVFKYVRAVNPVALGGIAVDSVGTIVLCFVDRQGSERRLSRLVERMKDSGAGVFVEIGNRLGDAIYEITQMPDKEFEEAMSLRNVGAWLRSLVE